MNSRLGLLSLALVACGGVVVDAAPLPSDAEGTAAHAAERGDAIDAGTAHDATPDAGPSIGLVWVHAEAAGFAPGACDSASGSDDFSALSTYVQEQLRGAGLEGAGIAAGGGQCHFVSPTSLSETDMFTGTPSSVHELLGAPPAPFVGQYLDVPIVVKEVTDVRFAFYVGDGVTHAFSDVWVHDGLDIESETTFMQDVCTKQAAFTAALATSAVGAEVETWLAGLETDVGYRLGYDATLTFADGATLAIPNAGEAAGSPYLGPCPNLVQQAAP